MPSENENMFNELKVFLQKIVNKHPEDQEFITSEYKRLYAKYLPQSTEEEMEVLESESEVSL